MLNLRPKAARDDETDLTPLIDMVFILLIFFILAASFAVRGIDLDLPPAHSGQALSGRVVEIRLLRERRLKNAKQQRYRDLYLYSAFTGLSFPDIRNMTQ